MDSLNNEPLGFVTLVFNEGGIGTVTNAFGEYSYTANVSIYKITCSYIGYATKEIPVRPSSTQIINISLVPSQYNLSQVVILSGDNPANRIVRNTVKNRTQNDPDRFNSYSYTAYNKFIYSGILPLDSTKKDSSLTTMMEFLKQQYFMIIESVVETKFLKPDKKENIIATKISGIKNPSFTLMNSQIQPLSFYGNYITLLGKSYLNPFSKGTTDRYFFNIEDTLYDGADTLYSLSFRPWKGRNFDGLRGIAEITSDGYAIKHIMAEPADTLSAMMRIRIDQSAEKVNGVWFPKRFVSEVRFSNMLNNGTQVMMYGTTTLSNIEIEPNIQKRDMAGIQVDIDALAAYRNEEFWAAHRPDSLTEQELRTYQVIDSLGKKHHFDGKLKLVEGLIGGELPYKFISFEIDRFVTRNQYEGFRLGAGLRTNETVFRNISIGGFAGYGFRDAGWKYGGDLRLRLYRPNDVFVDFSYSHSLEETGAIEFYKDNNLLISEAIRSTLITIFDKVERYQIDFTGRTLRYLHFDFSLFSAHKKSTSSYHYLIANYDGYVPLQNFQFSGIKLQLRYAYKEKITRTFNSTILSNPQYPILFTNITYGIPNLFGSQFTYIKLEAKLKSTIRTRSLGNFNLNLVFGYVDGYVPLSETFAGRGNYWIVGFYNENCFQTMRLNEFYSDKYAAVFLEQDLKSLLYRGKKFQPKSLLIFNAMIGSLSEADLHHNFDFKVPIKGYYEAGLVIYDIISKEYLGVARLGLGGGLFYRLGPYAFIKQQDNLAIKIQLTVNI